jgi:hypothetical protein
VFPAALLLGVLALVRIRRRGTRGTALAVAAVVIGAVELLVTTGLVVMALLTVRSGAPLPAQVTTARSANARQLVVGNCLAAVPADGPVDIVRVVPCGSTHAAEVVSSYTFDGDWPGQGAADRAVAASCALTDAQRAAGAHLVAWAPTAASWRWGDRTGLCLLVDG